MEIFQNKKLEYSNLIQRLTQKEVKPIGYEAQIALDPIPRKRIATIPSSVKEAAVMCLLINKAEAAHLLLMQRTSHPLDKHKGQISFVGGSREPFDRDLFHTATRETQEEVGLAPKHMQLITPLTSVYIPVSNFLMYPFLGYYSTNPEYVLQVDEVEKVIEIPISKLLNDRSIKTKDISISDKVKLSDVPYFDIEEHTIWGATAMVLAEIKAIIQNL